MTIRVLIADDMALVRAGITAIMCEFKDIQVTCEAGSGLEVMRFLQSQPIDLVITEIALPGINGIEVARTIRRDFPHVRVMILTRQNNEEAVLQALRAGVGGYVLKNTNALELHSAILDVMNDETYVSQQVSRHLVQFVRKTEPTDSSLGLLTQRQREILQLIAEGANTQKIAKTLNISIKTVETHRRQMMERLDIHDLAGLIRLAIRVGLIAQAE